MTTQDLINKLDKQYPSWDLYRTAMRQWCVTLMVEGQSSPDSDRPPRRKTGGVAEVHRSK
jgi:hypothetical protein